MCGICGKLNFQKGAAVKPALIREMMDTIRHRGPDDEGLHIASEVGLGFSAALDHRPSEAATSRSRTRTARSGLSSTVRSTITASCVNFLLSKGHIFKTQTDTEVIVHLYEELGPQCLEKFRGMFAFAIWDENTKTLFLARDRVGIKPLYYSLIDNSIVFASEIKAILADPAINRRLLRKLLTGS